MVEPLLLLHREPGRDRDQPDPRGPQRRRDEGAADRHPRRPARDPGRAHPLRRGGRRGRLRHLLRGQALRPGQHDPVSARRRGGAPPRDHGRRGGRVKTAFHGPPRDPGEPRPRPRAAELGRTARTSPRCSVSPSAACASTASTPATARSSPGSPCAWRIAIASRGPAPDPDRRLGRPAGAARRHRHFELIERPREIERENRKVTVAVRGTYDGEDWDDTKNPSKR